MTVPVMTPRAMREQSTFRRLLFGMARPGTVQQVDPGHSAAPLAAGVALLEALLDHEVSFAVCPPNPETEQVLLRLTGSHLVPPEHADYLLAREGGIGQALAEAQGGLPEYPDRGATIIAMVDSVSHQPGSGDELVLAGPGIRQRTSLWTSGFTPAHRRAFTERNGDLPLGIDLVLAAPDGSFACLPRYTRIQEGS